MNWNSFLRIQYNIRIECWYDAFVYYLLRNYSMTIKSLFRIENNSSMEFYYEFVRYDAFIDYGIKSNNISRSEGNIWKESC